MNILFFDHLSSGHHSEYVNHFLKHLSDDKNFYYILISEDLKNKTITHNKNNIQLICLNKSELNTLSGKSLMRQSVMLKQIVDKYATKLQIDYVFFLFLNIMQFGLLLKTVNYKCGGILFQPYTRIKIDNLKSFLRYSYKKYATYFLSKKIKDIFILNDESSVINLNVKFKTNVFKYLIDPLPNIKIEKNLNIIETYGLESKYIVLHPGSLSDRKGTLECINAISVVDDEIFQLVIAGAASGDFNKKIKDLIHSLDLSCKITYLDGYLDNNLLFNLFLVADVFLIPYKNPEASSGIFGHAVNLNKIVITPKKGLLGEMASNYSNSILLNNVNSKEIADAIEKAYNTNIRNPSLNVGQFSPKVFVNTVITYMNEI